MVRAQHGGKVIAGSLAPASFASFARMSCRSGCVQSEAVLSLATGEMSHRGAAGTFTDHPTHAEHTHEEEDREDEDHEHNSAWQSIVWSF